MTVKSNKLLKEKQRLDEFLRQKGLLEEASAQAGRPFSAFDQAEFEDTISSIHSAIGS